jgi:nucleotide-binding universal stress UspA family protein
VFTTIVVALDLTQNGDRALPVAGALSELAEVSVDLLTVSSMHVSEEVDEFELSRRATAHGWPAHSYCIVHSNDAAQAIADHVKGRDEVLLVMATSAKRPVLGHMLGSVSEAVLRLIDRPVLFVGPHVPADFTAANPTLIHCVDSGSPRAAAAAAIDVWTQTFRGPPTHTAEIAGRDEPPPVSLERIAGQFRGAVFVCTSTNLTSGHHWHSVTRELVRRSVHPVLVVPGHLDDHLGRNVELGTVGVDVLSDSS